MALNRVQSEPENSSQPKTLDGLFWLTWRDWITESIWLRLHCPKPPFPADNWGLTEVGQRRKNNRDRQNSYLSWAVQFWTSSNQYPWISLTRLTEKLKQSFEFEVIQTPIHTSLVYPRQLCIIKHLLYSNYILVLIDPIIFFLSTSVFFLLSCFNKPPYKVEDVVHALLLLTSCHWHSIVIWFQQWVEGAPTDLTKRDCVGHKNYMIGSKRLLINLVVLIEQHRKVSWRL